jgi:putative ABC transport system permease protein
MNTLMQDVRFALRMLLKNPGLTLVAVVTLGVAIGANTTIFSAVNSVILQPLPYPQPERLVRIDSQFPALHYDRFPVSAPEFLDLVEHTRSYESLAAWVEDGVSVTGGREPVRVPAALMRGPLFQTLGVSPLMGRVFSREEDRPGDPSAVVLSHGLWVRGFGRDPAIVGKRINIDAVPVTVIGVMPEQFAFPSVDTDVWLPMKIDLRKGNRGGHYLRVIGRLRPDMSLAEARSDLASYMAWSKERYGDDHANAPPVHPVVVNALSDETIASAKWSLLLLQGAVAFLLLIAAANIASLLLARGEARSREIAIRAAIGAGRLRIVRQLLTEALVLGLLGAGLGLAIAVWGVEAMVRLLPEGAPRMEEIAIDGWVLAVGIGCSLFVSLLFGLAPALHARVDNLHHGLQEGGGRATFGRTRLRLRRTLVVVEIALAMVLVIGCGLMLRSFARVQEVELGFDPARMVTMQIQLPEKTYPDADAVNAAWERLQGEVRRLPGVRGATLMQGMLPARPTDANDIYFVGKVQPVEGDGLGWNVDYWQVIGEDYFSTMGIRVVRGRAPDARDRRSPSVVLVNEALARKFFPGEDPLGRQVSAIGDESGPFQTVIGVVGNVKQGGLDKPTGTELYVPMRLVAPLFEPLARQTGQDISPRLMYLAVRADADPRALVRSIRRVVSDIDPGLALAEVRTMDEILWQAVARPRFFAALLGGFAGIALLLAAIGIFGVMSYSISQRTRELGIRMALGAPPTRVRRMVLREGMLLVVTGVVLGLAGAAALNTALSRVLADMLFEVAALDLTTFIAVPILIAAVGALACWLPAARATRVDPILALRHD